MIISTKDLHSILHDSKNLIIDTRSFKEYSEGHIPGSVNLDLFAFHWIDTSKEGIETFNKQTRTLLSFAGVSEEKKIIFYDEVSGMLAARGVWMALYFSHPDVVMLDGGMKKWRQDKMEIETSPNNFNPTNFSGKINSSIISGYEKIHENLEHLTIIDARSNDEYNGKIVRAAHTGHIPNSINIDWALNLNEDGTLKNNSNLSKLYSFSKDSEIVTYCQGAYRAANSFIALKKLGFQNVRVYLGSWGEWGNHLELPVSK